MKMLILFLLIFNLTLISCKEYPCSPAIGNIRITGFSINETDTVMVRKYSKSGNFTTLLGTYQLDSLRSYYLRKGNVLEIYSTASYGNDFGLLSRYDYEIYLPKPNRLFQVSEITEDHQTRRSGISMDKSQCINPFTSFKVNSVLYVNGNDNSYLISISK